MVISNYELVEKIAEAPQSTIYKAYHKKEPQRPLTLKVLRADHLSEYKKTQIVQKIEHLKVLNAPLVLTPLSFGDKDGVCFVTQDFFDGAPLKSRLEGGSRISLIDFFGIACGLAKALEEVHEGGIIHGGVKPNNILIDSALNVRLIDFISALDVRDVSHFIYDPSFIRGTLAYTSPEQTGRINHRVVFASDFYSLGIVFYEMLTGRLPFFADDPLELIHFHLAKEALSVHKLDPEIPAALSNIVAKLLLKEPEKRYRSASGLLADLARCGSEYSASGTIGEFALESRVHAHRTAFISKMVGRDREAEIILDEYEQAARGAFRSLFVSGLPGIGKTRLIQELQKPIVKHRGYFTSGKFDIYQKNVPYSSLIQAFRNLVRAFLTESNERTEAWKTKVLLAVGDNGKVLTDVIPELEFLIGRQPEVKPLPPVEALNRFHDLFDRFLASLAGEENPLTLFIDDLQWCDTASFDFLSNIFSNYKDHPYLFFLGAYRHNEVDPSHPLTKLIRSARESGEPLKEIRLGPLAPEHCHEMVSYILDSPLSRTGALSDFITGLTEGNPLFVSESLSFLHNEDVLLLNEEGEWRWDMESVRRSSMPATVVGLFVSKIQKLPPELVTLLEYCACMGNTFLPAEVSLVREMTLTETFRMLKPALEQGLLMENRNQLQFIHDRVQEAALSALTPERRRHIHRQIGNHLVAAVPANADVERLDNLFAIVSHLNLGREGSLDPDAAYALSDLNYHAGNKALDSLATEAANEYFELARELLPKDCWGAGHYERTFRIYQKAAKTELMCGNFEESERLINHLLDHAATDLDKTEALAEQAASLSSIGNFIKAIETANRGLAYFRKAIPEDPAEVNKKREELIGEIASRGIDVRKTFLEMPFATGRKAQVEHAFYSELLADLYLSGRVPELYLVGAQATLHCLSAGMDEAVMYAFTAMAIYFAEHEQYEQSFAYEDLTYDLAARYPNTFGATKCLTGAVVTLMHSRSHPGDVAAYSLKAIHCGKSCGDLNNAGYSYGPLMWNLALQGADLPAVEEHAKECFEFSTRYHLGIATGLAEAVQAGWVEPMKKDPAPLSLEGKLAQWEQDNHVVSLGSYYVLRAFAHCYLGEAEEARQCLVEGRKYLAGFSNSILKRQWHVLWALNAISLYERGKGYSRQAELMAEIRPMMEQIERWAALGPSLKPYLAFLYAELERVTGEFKAARALYLDAIDGAHEQGYVLLEGHLHECFAKLLDRSGRNSGSIYFTEALRLYRKCRAEKKEAKLSEALAEDLFATTTSATTATATTTLPDLDVEYLMKCSLAISAEMEQEALLKKVMDVLIESSGAQHGYLLMEEEGDLVVRAESDVGGQAKALGRKLEAAGDLCKAIVRYVFRTGEKMLLNDACQEGAF
ncbi:MAG: AAA family ATPase, partial [Deltaproteobacteria bacterium]|nr:AAA family ATPase [Deltaproteobacteria bacterium]